MDFVVYIPTGFFQFNQAWRTNLSGITKAPFPVFWDVDQDLSGGMARPLHSSFWCLCIRVMAGRASTRARPPIQARTAAGGSDKPGHNGKE